MDKYSNHPVRLALTLVAFLCGLSCFAFSNMPVMILPFIPLAVGWIFSRKKALAMLGAILLLLMVSCLVHRPMVIDGFRYEMLVTGAVPLFLVWVECHHHLSKSRKQRTMNAGT